MSLHWDMGTLIHAYILYAYFNSQHKNIATSNCRRQTSNPSHITSDKNKFTKIHLLMFYCKLQTCDRSLRSPDNVWRQSQAVCGVCSRGCTGWASGGNVPPTPPLELEKQIHNTCKSLVLFRMLYKARSTVWTFMTLWSSLFLCEVL